MATLKQEEEAQVQAQPKRQPLGPPLVADAVTYEYFKKHIQPKFEFPSRPGGHSYSDEDPENEHYQHYIKLVEESQGFYIPKVPPGVKLAYTRGQAIPDCWHDIVEQRARDALSWYNKEKKGDETYELVKVECGSHVPSRGIKYYIALIARGVVSGVEEPFRAVVHNRVGGVINVESCEKAAESCAKFTQLNGLCC